MKKLMKKQKGITLIALVVTIIVLLILAAVSIAMLTGQSGILSQAGTARDKSERANIIEDAQRDLLDEMTKQETEITEDMLKGILNKYFLNVPNKLPDDLSTLTLTSKDGKYNDILASEVYKGTFTETSTGERLEDMYYLEGYCDDATNEIYNIKMEFLPDIESKIDISKFNYPKPESMTDEELALLDWWSRGWTQSQTFEGLVDDLIERRIISEKVSTGEELFIKALRV